MSTKRARLAAEIRRDLPDLNEDQADAVAGCALYALADLKQRDAEAEAGNAPTPLSADAAVRAADLLPGRLIQRWTETTRTGDVRAPMPCHEYAWVAVKQGQGLEHVARCSCGRTFDLLVEQEWDGGYLANFTVAERQYLQAKKKAPAKRAKRQGRTTK